MLCPHIQVSTFQDAERQASQDKVNLQTYKKEIHLKGFNEWRCIINQLLVYVIIS